MKRYSISWRNHEGSNSVDSVEVIASTFTKALHYCETKVKGFVLDNVSSVYSYNDVLIAE